MLSGLVNPMPGGDSLRFFQRLDFEIVVRGVMQRRGSRQECRSPHIWSPAARRAAHVPGAIDDAELSQDAQRSRDVAGLNASLHEIPIRHHQPVMDETGLGLVLLHDAIERAPLMDVKHRPRWTL